MVCTVQLFIWCCSNNSANLTFYLVLFISFFFLYLYRKIKRQVYHFLNAYIIVYSFRILILHPIMTIQNIWYLYAYNGCSMLLGLVKHSKYYMCSAPPIYACNLHTLWIRKISKATQPTTRCIFIMMLIITYYICLKLVYFVI